jgi:hypothetical protein
MEPAVGALLFARKRKEYDRKWHKIRHALPLSGTNGTLLFRSSSRLSLADLIKTQEDECDRKLRNEYEGCVLHHSKRTPPRGVAIWVATFCEARWPSQRSRSSHKIENPNATPTVSPR